MKVDGANLTLYKKEIEKLERMSRKFEELEEELSSMVELWNILIAAYNGHPLASLDEFLEDLEEENGVYKFIG